MATVLVTGGAGFIGSHVVEEFLAAGYSVRVYDNLTSGIQDNLLPVQRDIEFVHGDVTDAIAVEHACRGVDAICHLAAQLEITRCLDDPVQDLRVNTEGTLNVLESARLLEIPKVVYASSACVYGQAEHIPEGESHPTKPNWPYGVSKLAAEHYARLYHEHYGLSTLGLRFSIVYGPREWYGRVLTIFLRRALDGLPPVIFGDGTQQRDFVYVRDVARLVRLCIQDTTLRYDVLNASTGVSTTVRELADLVCRTFGVPHPLHDDVLEGNPSRLVAGRIRLPAELQTMVLDNGRARQLLGWSPNVTLAEGIIGEMEWLRGNAHMWQVMHY